MTTFQSLIICSQGWIRTLGYGTEHPWGTSGLAHLGALNAHSTHSDGPSSVSQCPGKSAMSKSTQLAIFLGLALVEGDQPLSKLATKEVFKNLDQGQRGGPQERRRFWKWVPTETSWEAGARRAESGHSLRRSVDDG